jgi:hypothetical protein
VTVNHPASTAPKTADDHKNWKKSMGGTGGIKQYGEKWTGGQQQ